MKAAVFQYLAGVAPYDDAGRDAALDAELASIAAGAASLASEVRDAVPDELLRRASDVRTMPFPNADRAAYRAAGEAVLATVDRLVAVWDGVPCGRLGGTGDLVQTARDRDLPVTVAWPAGARRGSGR